MGARKYVGEVVKEGKRVRWPKRDVFLPALISIIIITVVAALVLTFEDWITATLLSKLRELFQGL
jgi:preprotein translocase SecE subunit